VWKLETIEELEQIQQKGEENTGGRTF